jgi:chitin synthase
LFIYNAIQLFFTWTSLANFYLAFFFVSLPFSCLWSMMFTPSQLVSSATATPKTDAFNFLSEGAGKDISEVILKVSRRVSS